MEYTIRQNRRIERVLDRLPILGDILKRPLGVLGFSIVFLFVLTTIFAPFIAPYNPSKQDFSAIFSTPCPAHWL
jgi:peptide/nickel transport system permease protein